MTESLIDVSKRVERELLMYFIGCVPQIEPGAKVKFVKQWPDGKRIWMEGTLLFIRRECCYVDTPIAGIVEGEAGTLEKL